jgi:SAM-dependent MidA family methyltransferase
VTPTGELLAAEIERDGPIPLRRFMEVALYHPKHGYYRRARDPFGKGGDFFTAEQIQPVFGILVAARVRQLFRTMGEPREFTVVELGAGRREMAEAFAEWNYAGLDLDRRNLPASVSGVVFSNEFFDALPVDAARFERGAFREQRVAWRDGAFHWHAGGVVGEEADQYLHRYYPAPDEGGWYEVNLAALRWMERIAAMLTKGYLLTVDYGYTRAESRRFSAGTLMSYHRHTAREDIFTDPGERDITAHVNFTALQERGAEVGLRGECFQTLAQMLLAAGEADQFAAALAGEDEMRRRMQLKTLLFGMGETFRVLLQCKETEPAGVGSHA